MIQLLLAQLHCDRSWFRSKPSCRMQLGRAGGYQSSAVSVPEMMGMMVLMMVLLIADNDDLHRGSGSRCWYEASDRVDGRERG